MYPTLKQYIEQAKGKPPTKTIADYVAELNPIDLLLFENLYEAYKDKQPFAGQKILFNQHQDRITWLFMLTCQALGATVVASKRGLTELPFAGKALRASNITYFEDGVIENPDSFLLAFDCGAGVLNKLNPLKGFIEQTNTDPTLYQNINVPVYTIDHTATKFLEAICGTGEAIVQSLKPLMRQKLAREIGIGNKALNEGDIDYLAERKFKSKYYVLIGGAGKVAAGIARALIKQDVPKNHIILVDKNREQAFVDCMPETQGLNFLNTGIEDPVQFKQAILAYMQNIQPDENFLSSHFLSSVVIGTATGVEELLTRNKFDPKDFSDCIFFNAGQPDEPGENFSTDDMIGDTKKALNFHPKRLEKHQFPTDPPCVLPSLLLMLRQALDQIQQDLPRGLKHVSAALDKEVFEAACDVYKQKEFSTLLPIAQKLFFPVSRGESPNDSATLSHQTSSPPPSPDRNFSTTFTVNYKRRRISLSDSNHSHTSRLSASTL